MNDITDNNENTEYPGETGKTKNAGKTGGAGNTDETRRSPGETSAEERRKGAAPPWMARIDPFFEEHREDFRKARLSFEKNHENALVFELLFTTPNDLFFAQVYERLSHIAALTRSLTDVSFFPSVAHFDGKKGIRATFALEQPNERLIERLEALFYRSLRKFRFRPEPPPTTTPPEPNPLPVRSDGPKFVPLYIRRNEVRGGSITDDPQEVISFNYPIDGSAAREPQPVIPQLPSIPAEYEESPDPADIPQEANENHLTPSRQNGKRTSTPLALVVDNKETPPAREDREVVDPDVLTAPLRAEIESLRQQLEEARLQLGTLSSRNEVLENTVAELQGRLRDLELPQADIPETAERREELPEEVISALKGWPDDRRTVKGVDGKRRKENAEQFVERVLREHYGTALNAQNKPQIRLSDLQNGINSSLYRALMTGKSRHDGFSESVRPFLLTKSDSLTQEAEAAFPGYLDNKQRFREAHRLTAALSRRK